MERIFNTHTRAHTLSKYDDDNKNKNGQKSITLAKKMN